MPVAPGQSVFGGRILQQWCLYMVTIKKQRASLEVVLVYNSKGRPYGSMSTS